jgi:hypothetical protein
LLIKEGAPAELPDVDRIATAFSDLQQLLRMGQIIGYEKLAKLAKLNNNASLACPLRHWA